jgi:hypothetical protein
VNVQTSKIITAKPLFWRVRGRAWSPATTVAAAPGSAGRSCPTAAGAAHGRHVARRSAAAPAAAERSKANPIAPTAPPRGKADGRRRNHGRVARFPPQLWLHTATDGQPSEGRSLAAILVYFLTAINNLDELYAVLMPVARHQGQMTYGQAIASMLRPQPGLA